MVGVSHLIRRAESILNVAASPGADPHSSAIVVDRTGYLRVLRLDGWTRSGLIEEFAATEVYIIKKRAGTVTVEGWTASSQCTMSRGNEKTLWTDLLPMHAGLPYAAKSQVTPQLASGLNDLAPSVWNS